jgi:hypothetical protein
MIKTSIGTELDYHDLEKIIEQKLNIDSNSDSYLQVRCFPREENLVIFVEHPEEIISHPPRLFKVIRNIIDEKKIIGEVLIYLVVHGSSEPYLSNEISIAPDNNTLAIIKSSDIPGNSHTAIKLQPSETEPPKSNLPYPLIALSTGLIILVVISFGYFFSKPCTIGKCLLLSENQALADKSLDLITQENGNLNLLSLQAIQQQLTEAIANINSIPSWSKYYPEANQLSQRYQKELNIIENYLTILETEQKAEYFKEKGYLSLEDWQTLANSWEEALNLLKIIPEDKQNNFFNNKEQEYQKTLTNIQAKIAKEKEGNQYLSQAKNAAQLAETRQKETKSLEKLQLVEATWKTAIERLEQIPVESNAYQEKENLLKSYLPKFMEVEKRRKQQQQEADFLEKALVEKKLAEQSETENQWTKAVSSWQKGIELLSQVTENNFKYEEAKKLLITYQESLEKAQAQLKIAVRKQQLKKDLQNICSNTVTICSYSLNEQKVKVVLTNVYLQRVQELSTLLQSQEETTDNLIKNHIYQVENNLKYLSLKYNIGIEVYHPNGQLITQYQQGQ